MTSLVSPTGAAGAIQSVFFTDWRGIIFHIFSNSAWQWDSPWAQAGASVGVQLGTPISSFLDPSFVTGAQQAIFYVGTDKHIHHLFASPGPWTHDDLTALINSVLTN